MPGQSGVNQRGGSLATVNLFLSNIHLYYSSCQYTQDSHLYIFHTLLYAHSFLFTLHPDQPPTALLLVSGPSRLLAHTGAVASRTTAAATSQLLAGSKLALRLATEGAAGWQ